MRRTRTTRFRSWLLSALAAGTSFAACSLATDSEGLVGTDTACDGGRCADGAGQTSDGNADGPRGDAGGGLDATNRSDVFIEAGAAGTIACYENGADAAPVLCPLPNICCTGGAAAQCIDPNGPVTCSWSWLSCDDSSDCPPSQVCCASWGTNSEGTPPVGVMCLQTCGGIRTARVCDPGRQPDECTQIGMHCAIAPESLGALAGFPICQ